jgi:hypothetical protein
MSLDIEEGGAVIDGRFRATSVVNTNMFLDQDCTRTCESTGDNDWE